MNHPIYYAKSEKNGKHPTVGEHLAAVSELAGHYGAEVGMEAAAALAGKLHDFGKYSEAFQGVLQHTRQSVDHALPGAGFLCNAAKPTRGVKMTAAVINGHHDGLKSFDAIKDYIRQSQAERTVCNAGKNPRFMGKRHIKKRVEHGYGISRISNFRSSRFRRIRTPRIAFSPIWRICCISSALCRPSRRGGN